MKPKMRKLFIAALLCLALCSILYIFIIETKPSVRLSVIAVNLILGALIFHASYQNRKTRQTLRRERDHLRNILDNIPMPLFIVDKNRSLNFINAAAMELFNCTGEILGKPCHCLGTCICNTPSCAIEQMTRSGNKRTYYEAEGKTYMVSTAALELGTQGDGRYVELIQDITDVVEAKKLLEEKTIELETMSENIIGGILITTLEEGYPVLRCNQGYRDMTGRDEAQILGHRALQWVLPEDAARLNSKITEQLLASNQVSLEHRLHVEDGSLLWVSLRGKRCTLRGQTVGVWILTDINAAKKVELALRIDEERYRIAMQSTEDIIIDYDINSHVMYHSSKAKEVYGVPELMEKMPESILDNGTVLQESRQVYLDLFRQLSENVKSCSCVLKTRAADGRILWNRLTFTSIFDDEGNTARAIGILQDITRERKIELQQQREARYLEISSQDGNVYYEADLTKRVFLSGHESAVQTFGESTSDNFDAVVELLLRHRVFEQDRALVREKTAVETLTAQYEAGVSRSAVEYRRIMGDKLVWSECSVQIFLDTESVNLHCIGCIRNIHQMKIKELALQEKAERDLLTGIYNKITAELMIQNATDFIPEDAVSGAFLLIDVDDFKNVNDSLGHASGDEVLKKVAQGLISLFPGGDIVGRMGGDEFVAYINHIDNDEIALKKAGQICEMFHGIGISSNADFSISGTVGIALFPAHGNCFDRLYRNADTALYGAKRQGKDRFALFSPTAQ
ncbi:MAG: diguanylate cyclase [Oscillospiraceae bacterium]